MEERENISYEYSQSTFLWRNKKNRSRPILGAFYFAGKMVLSFLFLNKRKTCRGAHLDALNEYT